MLPGQPAGPVFHELAGLARQGLAISAAAFAVTYLAGYRRHARRVMQSVEGAEGAPGRLRTAFDAAVNRWLLPHPLERATFHFINNTILRNAKQRLFLATYGGIAVALALPAVLQIGARPGRPSLSFHAAGLLSVPLTLSFFAVSGLRAAFNFPAELRANWIFQICESEDSMPHMRAARKWIVLMGMAPLFGLLAPIEVYFRGWRLGFIHLTFALGALPGAAESAADLVPQNSLHLFLLPRQDQHGGDVLPLPGRLQRPTVGPWRTWRPS